MIRRLFNTIALPVNRACTVIGIANAVMLDDPFLRGVNAVMAGVFWSWADAENRRQLFIDAQKFAKQVVENVEKRQG